MEKRCSRIWVRWPQAHGGQVERMPVEPGHFPDRFNILAWWGNPVVTLSTHMDTVPPFFASREDETHIWGRGACDTKGIIASMIFAVEELLREGQRNLALLFVVGEERNSTGAIRSRQASARIEIPDQWRADGKQAGAGIERRAAAGSGRPSGRMAHSAYPELGDSAILKLLDALNALRHLPLPTDKILGASTLNIGTISGGRAPNVIPDQARRGSVHTPGGRWQRNTYRCEESREWQVWISTKFYSCRRCIWARCLVLKPPW